MKNRPATPEEKQQCVELYTAIGRAMEGKGYDEILNTLCFIIADLGVDLDMSKQLFIANVVEQVSSAYDTCYLNRAEPEGEA